VGVTIAPICRSAFAMLRAGCFNVKELSLLGVRRTVMKVKGSVSKHVAQVEVM